MVQRNTSVGNSVQNPDGMRDLCPEHRLTFGVMLRLAYIACFLVMVSGAFAQNVTIINHYGDTTGLGPDALFYLTGSEEHTVVVNFYEPASERHTQRLEQLVCSATSLYLDEMTYYVGSQVRFRKRQAKLMKDLNLIVSDAVQFYNYKELSSFAGFSDKVAGLLSDMEELELSNFDGPADPGMSTRESMKQRWLDQGLVEVKIQINKEIGLFATDNILVPERQVSGKMSAEERSRLLEDIDAFQTHDPLDPLAFGLSDESTLLLASEDTFTLPEMPGSRTPPANASDFETRVFELLQGNADRLEALSGTVNNLDNPDRVSHADRALQLQIDELRNTVEQLVSARSVGSTPTLVPNLPGTVTVHFGKGATNPDAGGQFVLSEVVDLLAHNPELHVVLTGFADKTGNSTANQRIARERAAAIRSVLISSGIQADRIVVNQFGDARSTGPNPDDRKVEITFIHS